jgi:hypothetical protein
MDRPHGLSNNWGNVEDQKLPGTPRRKDNVHLPYNLFYFWKPDVLCAVSLQMSLPIAPEGPGVPEPSGEEYQQLGLLSALTANATCFADDRRPPGPRDITLQHLPARFEDDTEGMVAFELVTHLRGNGSRTNKLTFVTAVASKLQTCD